MINLTLWAKKGPSIFLTEWRTKARLYLAEFLGIFVAIAIELCGSLSITTSNLEAGSYQSSNWTWGFGKSPKLNYSPYNTSCANYPSQALWWVSLAWWCARMRTLAL